jgi:2-polyprenyl-3-methyl-5-hydroxy-6-metoxy-1,4-benzoquinol methylase
MASTNTSNGKLIVIQNDEICRIIDSVQVEMTDLEWTEMAVDTYLHYNPLIRWLMWTRLKATVDFALLDKTKEVLDFGCGIGLMLPTLAKYAKIVYAMDLFPQFAKKLAEIKQVAVHFIDSLSVINNGSLGIIFATDVIEHLDDPKGFIKTFGSKLIPGGQLIISGPTETVIYRIGRFLAGFHKKGDYHHWNINDIEQICISNGFKLVKKRRLPFSFLPSLFNILLFVKH